MRFIAQSPITVVFEKQDKIVEKRLAYYIVCDIQNSFDAEKELDPNIRTLWPGTDVALQSTSPTIFTISSCYHKKP